MDMSLSKLRVTVKDREAGGATVHEIAKSQTWLNNWTTTTTTTTYFKFEYNFNIALYSFHEYNMLISYFHILWNDHCDSLININHHIEMENCFLVVRTFKIDSLSNFRIYVMINYSHHYIARTHLFYNWKFVPLDPLHPFKPFPHYPHHSGNHQSVLCVYELDFLLVYFPAFFFFNF